MKLQRVVSSSLTRAVVCRIKLRPTEANVFCATEPRLVEAREDEADSMLCVACGVVGGGIFGTRVVTAVFGSVVATGGSTAVLASVVGYLATACCRQQC